METKRARWAVGVVAWSTVLACAHRPNTIATEDALQVPTGAPRVVRVLGRVEHPSCRNLYVRLDGIHAMGHPIALYEGVTPCDRTGKYEIELVLPFEVPALVIRAESESDRGLALFSGSTLHEGILIAPPMDLETAIETEVFLASWVNGFWNADVHVARFRAMLTRDWAEAIQGAEDYEYAVALAAKATAAAMKAWGDILLHPSVGVTPKELSSALHAITWAQADLDARLYAAGNLEEQQLAHLHYRRTVALAYAHAGIHPFQLLLARRAATDAMIHELHAELESPPADDSPGPPGVSEPFIEKETGPEETTTTPREPSDDPRTLPPRREPTLPEHLPAWAPVLAHGRIAPR